MTEFEKEWFRIAREEDHAKEPKKLPVQHLTSDYPKYGYSGESCQKCGSPQCDGKPCFDEVTDQEQRWGEERVPDYIYERDVENLD